MEISLKNLNLDIGGHVAAARREVTNGDIVSHDQLGEFFRAAPTGYKGMQGISLRVYK